MALLLLLGLQALLFAPLLLVCCLQQTSKQKNLQHELHSLQTSILRLSEQLPRSRPLNSDLSPRLPAPSSAQLTTSVSLPWELGGSVVDQLGPTPTTDKVCWFVKAS